MVFFLKFLIVFFISVFFFIFLFLFFKRKNLLDKIVNYKHWKEIKALAEETLALEPKFAKLTEKDLQKYSNILRTKVRSGISLIELLPEAYALVREVSRRKVNLFPFPCQVLGAVALHFGNVAEMKTGEGKTLTSVMTIYLNALIGKGVHVVTVNEYLAERDANLNKPIFDFLGLSVGINLSSLSFEAKKKAYACDITYTTNSELGFDYLRDNLAIDLEGKVQRELYFIIIDEIDSVVVDEALTPLLISWGEKYQSDFYKIVDKCLKTFDSLNYRIEERRIFLTPSGIKKVEEFFNLENLFALENARLFYFVQNSLHANYLLKKDVEYAVVKGKIVLIDKLRQRLKPDTSYSHGLHQAIEAKENVEIHGESKTVATITYQNFFRLYDKISGMTGTAKTEEEEFVKIYNMKVIVIPTNKPMIRIDLPDFVFATKKAKIKFFLKEVKKRHFKGQPILICTPSVEYSEEVAALFQKEKLKFYLLNAKNHLQEAEIVKNAGKKYSLIITTNISGRGTDIKLQKGVKELGGLCVMILERNDARRIDNQFKGRAGRQGDIGISLVFTSMEDKLLANFISPALKNFFLRLGDEFLQSRFWSKQISKAQQKLESLNFDIRKNLLNYDNVIAQQREAFYQKRDEILSSDDLTKIVYDFYQIFLKNLLKKHSDKKYGEIFYDVNKIINFFKINNLLQNDILFWKSFQEKKQKALFSNLKQMFIKEFEKKKEKEYPWVFHHETKKTILKAFDNNWTNHLENTDKLRWSVNLRSYAQINPFQVYIEETNNMFTLMKKNIAHDFVIRFHHAGKKQQPITSGFDLLYQLLVKNFTSVSKQTG